MRLSLAAFLSALIALAFASPLRAANLVVNGDFEGLNMTSGNAPHSTIIDDGTTPYPHLTGWRTSGSFNFVMVNNPTYMGTPSSLTGADDRLDGAYTTGNPGGAGGSRFSLYGPDTGHNNGLTNSPTGGNFLAADGSYLNRPVEQTLSGLTVGTTYYLSFYWAAAQQYNLPGNTKEAWIACLGTCEYHASPFAEGLSFFDADPGGTEPGYANGVNNLGYNPANTSQIFKTAVIDNPSGGFSPWRFQVFSFVAQADTQKLSLLAYGTPLGQPPFSLIDGVVIDTIVPYSLLPEPTSWAMMMIGFGVIGGVMRTRRRPAGGRGALGSQIV